MRKGVKIKVTPLKGKEGSENLNPVILDSPGPKEAKTAKKSILAKKSYGMTYRTTLMHVKPTWIKL